jgi:hypothetical protein
LGKSFQDYVEMKNYELLKPWSSLNEKFRSIYVEILRLAALKYPLTQEDLFGQVSYSHWVEDADKSVTVTFMELCRLYNLFIERIPDSDNLWRVTYPEICLDAMEFQHNRLPFWKCYYKMTCGEALTSEIVLDVIRM